MMYQMSQSIPSSVVSACAGAQACGGSWEPGGMDLAALWLTLLVISGARLFLFATL